MTYMEAEPSKRKRAVDSSVDFLPKKKKKNSEKLGKRKHPIYSHLEMQRDFYHDRPGMAAHNQDIWKTLELMRGEVVELNGHSEYGMTINGYRRQELSDILLFALAGMMVLDHQPNTQRIEAIRESYGVVQDEVVPSISPTQYGRHYNRIKREMVKHVESYFQADQHRETISPEELALFAEDVWAMAATLIVFVGGNLDDVKTKIARNMLKYPPGRAAEDVSPEGYEQYRVASKSAWSAQNNRPSHNGGDWAFFSDDMQGYGEYRGKRHVAPKAWTMNSEMDTRETVSPAEMIRMQTESSFTVAQSLLGLEYKHLQHVPTVIPLGATVETR